MNCRSKKEILAPWCLYTITSHSQIFTSSTQKSTVTVLTLILARLTACKLSGPYPHIRVTQSMALRSLFRLLCQLPPQQVRVLSHLPALSPRDPHYLPLPAQSQTATHTVTTLVTGGLPLTRQYPWMTAHTLRILTMLKSAIWKPGIQVFQIPVAPYSPALVIVSSWPRQPQLVSVQQSPMNFEFLDWRTSLAIVDNGNCQPINQTTPGTISSCECWMNVHGYNGGSTFL